VVAKCGVRAYLIPGGQQEMEDGGVLLPHKLLHKFLLLFFHQVLAALYETIKSGVDDLEGLSAPPLPGHYGPKKRNIPVWHKGCASVFSFSQAGVYSLQVQVHAWRCTCDHIMGL